MSNGLNQIADPAGRFSILAMDQRGTLRAMLERAAAPSADRDLRAFKVDVVRALSPLASGVLTDVEYGVAAIRAAGALAAGSGLLIASEHSPQPTWNGEPRTEYDAAHRGPAFVAALGGVALKFLVRWRPDRRPASTGDPDLAREAIDAVRLVVNDCKSYGLPSVIEPLATGPPGEDLSARQRGRLVVRSAQLLAEQGPDLLKLEWPGSADGCRELTNVCGRVPWALLSAGVPYEQFVKQVLIAMDAGACGYIAGRAFWGEAVPLCGAQRRQFLHTVAAKRMDGLNAAIAGRGRSWCEVAGR